MGDRRSVGVAHGQEGKLGSGFQSVEGPPGLVPGRAGDLRLGAGPVAQGSAQAIHQPHPDVGVDGPEERNGGPMAGDPVQQAADQWLSVIPSP